MKPELAGTDAFDLLTDALGGLNEGCALFDEDGRLIVCNALFREMNAPIREFILAGVHWETMLREMSRRRVVPQAIGREEAWISQILVSADSTDPFDIEHTDGAVTSVRVRPTSRGGFIVSETDITERRRAERAARESEQLLSTLLQASPANLCMSQIGDGTIVYQSPASVDLFGNAESARDQFADPLDRADFLTELLASDRIDDFPATARRKDGTEFPALFSARVIDYRNEEVMVSTVTDLSEMVAAEQTIKEAGVRLRDAIEALSEGFILYDADERVVMANQRFREMNAPYADLITPGTQTRVLLEAAVETKHFVDATDWLADYDTEFARGDGGSHRTFEFRMSDGTWVNSVRRPTRDGGFVITWLDVTDEKLATTELARTSDRMRDAIDSVDEGFALFDKQDRLVMWNRRYEELNAHVADSIHHGAHFPDILQRSIDSDLLEEDAAEQTRNYIAKRDYHQRARDEFQLRNGNWYSVSHSPTKEGGFVVTRHDITNQKAAAEELARLKDRLEDAIESLDEGFALYDAQDRLVAWNTRYSELNQSIAHVIREGATYQEILEAAITERQLGAEEATIVRASGSRRDGNKRMRFEFESREGRWFSVARNPTSEDGFVITRADITERKLAEEELDRQREMLHQSEKLSALGELLAGVAHELNNPLSVVVGHALMLEEELEDPAILKRTRKISAAAERCSRIVKTFLAMARQRPTKLELTSMNTIVETALEVAGYGLRSAGVSVAHNLAPDLPQVNADSDQLVQVLANLIVNAEHVLAPMGAEGQLIISTRLSRSGKDVVLDLIDNGPGIPEGIRARIFEPFFTTKTVGEGTGIGLAFCHRVIATHEGTIQALEAPGGGAQFSIRLAATQPEAERATDGQKTTSNVGEVLVIDDEKDVADLIAHILDRDGFDVTIVHSAEKALERLPGSFDLILSDINMPGLNGMDLLASINDRWPGLDTRLGFITGDTMSANAEEFLRKAGRPYLEKPITPTDLRALTARIMNNRQGEPDA
ncbi:MAG: PAS-domain containing protein [Pseudomonadota bacterium]